MIQNFGQLVYQLLLILKIELAEKKIMFKQTSKREYFQQSLPFSEDKKLKEKLKGTPLKCFYFQYLQRLK
jgi:hypothetical protein